MQDGSGSQSELPQPRLTVLDRLFVLSSLPFPLGALVAFVLEPSWALALVTLCLVLVVACIVASRRRRRQALAMRQSPAADPSVQRAAAKFHLQEAGLLLLAVALFFAAVIPLRSLY